MSSQAERIDALYIKDHKSHLEEIRSILSEKVEPVGYRYKMGREHIIVDREKVGEKEFNSRLLDLEISKIPYKFVYESPTEPSVDEVVEGMFENFVNELRMCATFITEKKFCEHCQMRYDNILTKLRKV